MSVRVVCGVLMVTLALVACGDPEGADPGPTAPATPTDGTATPGLVIAPDCHELLEDERLATRPESPPPQPGIDYEELERWASDQPGFAGAWMYPPGSGEFTVGFTDEVEARRDDARERFGEDVRVVEAEHSMAEFEALAEEIGRDVEEARQDPDADPHRPAPGTIAGWGIMPQIGRLAVDVIGGDDAALAELTARYGADRVCLDVHELAEPMDPDGPVRPLAKASGWRDDGLLAGAFALVEIAYDRPTAERAWGDNVPAGLPEQEGDPAEEGRYGTLDDVDFDKQAVVVWSTGESGTCPGWLADIDAVDGRIVVDTGEAGTGVCTADYHPYRMVLAVDRDRLPGAADLPMPAPDDEPTAPEVRAYE